jgi:hypothetical protein
LYATAHWDAMAQLDVPVPPDAAVDVAAAIQAVAAQPDAAPAAVA